MPWCRFEEITHARAHAGLGVSLFGICLYAERGVLMFQKKWYESEIKYLEQQIALLERDA
jgi:hypothetical protein